MSLIVDEHRNTFRTGIAWRPTVAAIEELVKPGFRRGGTWAPERHHWGLLACRPGHGESIRSKRPQLIGLTRESCQTNGSATGSRSFKDFSTQAHIPEQADSSFSTRSASSGLDAGIFEYFSDARRRF